MNYTMTNGRIFVAINPIGAELISLIDLEQNNKEYMWSRDPAYWSGSAPNLFPVVGRLKNKGQYTYRGKPYTICTPHGFLRKSLMNLSGHDENSMEFCLRANAQTKAQYPFDFEYRVLFTMNEKTLTVRYTVKNTGDDELIFALGAHPGFKLPITDGEQFEDYYIEFSEPSTPRRVLMDDAVLLTGQTEPYPLQDGKILPLRHDLFDNDAVVLENAPKSVTIRSNSGKNGVKVNYADFPYVGFWHANKTDAPYVCVEPWLGLPSLASGTEDLQTKPAMLRTAPGEIYQASYSIEIW